LAQVFDIRFLARDGEGERELWVKRKKLLGKYKDLSRHESNSVLELSKV